jgi:hypothetical protein
LSVLAQFRRLLERRRRYAVKNPGPSGQAVPHAIDQILHALTWLFPADVSPDNDREGDNLAAEAIRRIDHLGERPLRSVYSGKALVVKLLMEHLGMLDAADPMDAERRKLEDAEPELRRRITELGDRLRAREAFQRIDRATSAQHAEELSKIEAKLRDFEQALVDEYCVHLHQRRAFKVVQSRFNLPDSAIKAFRDPRVRAAINKRLDEGLALTNRLRVEIIDELHRRLSRDLAELSSVSEASPVHRGGQQSDVGAQQSSGPCTVEPAALGLQASSETDRALLRVLRSLREKLLALHFQAVSLRNLPLPTDTAEAPSRPQKSPGSEPSLSGIQDSPASGSLPNLTGVHRPQLPLLLHLLDAYLAYIEATP